MMWELSWAVRVDCHSVSLDVQKMSAPAHDFPVQHFWLLDYELLLRRRQSSYSVV